MNYGNIILFNLFPKNRAPTEIKTGGGMVGKVKKALITQNIIFFCFFK